MKEQQHQVTTDEKKTSVATKDNPQLKKSKKRKDFKKGKGSKPDSKPDEGKITFKPGNDIAWWIKEPSLMKDAVNVASNWIAGTDLAGQDFAFSPAGVVRFDLYPVYGCDKAATDPINVLSRDLYLKMFQKYRGITSYSATDLAQVLIAEIEIVRTIAHYERIYGVINRYSKLNVNMPFAEVEALGLTQSIAEHLRTHLADFRWDLNVLIRKAQRLCIMKDMSVLADSISLLGYEYLDHDNAKAQIIIFDINRFGAFSDTALTTGSCVYFSGDGSMAQVFDFNKDNMCDMLNYQLSSLLGSDGAQRIIADLVVWFGYEAMLTFEPLPEDYVVIPVYSEEILHKMHNFVTLYSEGLNQKMCNIIPTTMAAADKAAFANAVGVDEYYSFQFNGVTYTKLGVYDSSGTVAYSTVGSYDYPVSTVEVKYCFGGTPHVLDTYRAEPTPEVVIEGSLFKTNVKPYYNNGPDYHCVEIISNVFFVAGEVHTYRVTNQGTYVLEQVFNTVNTQAFALDAAGWLAILDWAPICFGYYGNPGLLSTAHGDIDNPIILYKNTLSRIHNSCVYSAFKSDAIVVK